jgi:hypothetical protein
MHMVGTLYISTTFQHVKAIIAKSAQDCFKVSNVGINETVDTSLSDPHVDLNTRSIEAILSNRIPITQPFYKIAMPTGVCHSARQV